MKTIHLFLIVALTFFAWPVFGSSAPDKLGSSPASHSATIVQSTLGLAQDTAITTYIYAKLAFHPNLANANLDLSTSKGKVTINGIVNNDDQAKEIRQIAESTLGVKSVDDSKIIISQQDSRLYAKMRSSAPPPQTAKNSLSSNRPRAQPSMQLSAADPLITDPDRQLSSETQSSFRAKIPAEAMTLAKAKIKFKPQAAPKSKQKQKKKSFHSKTVKKHQSKAHKSFSKKKTALVKTNKPGMKHPLKPLQKSHKKQKTSLGKLKKARAENRVKTKESIDQMTSSYLKTALLANETIPEE